MKVPKTQLAVKLIQPGKPPVIEVQEVPVMKPGYNQVLVKIEYSPIHPADISTIYGKYGGKRSLPFTPGTEGSGRVVKAGGGVRSWMMKGQKVGLIGPTTGVEGTWQQYVVCNAFNMVGIKESISFQQAALLAANPSTAIAAFHTLKKKGVRSIAQNAAAGAMGKILFKYLTEKGINVVNIVRTEEQENIMKESGAK